MPKSRNIVVAKGVKTSTQLSSGSYKKIAKIILGIILITALGYFFLANLHTKTLRDALTHQPERYSELYFTSPNNLPTIISSGQTLPIDFTIHNVESEPTSYLYYVVFTDSSGKTSIVAKGSLSLISNGLSNVNQTAHIPDFNGRGEIGVVIINQPESIHFWVEASSV